MKTYLKVVSISLVGAAFALAACGGDDTAPAAAAGAGGTSGSTGTSGSAGTSGSTGTSGNGGSSGGAGMDASAGTGGTGNTEAGTADAGPPMLGMQIDRLGRPGVNTALTDPFDIVPAMTKDEVKNAYNAEADPAQWSGKFKGYIATNLAILDALDSTASSEGCGNQLAIGAATDGGAVTRYNGLSTVLVDDRLYLNTKVGDSGSLTCGQYLAVEANATNIVPNGDCGGRTPKYDVIDTTYSALAAGLLSGVSDGVGPDGKVTDTFPFLAAPQ